MCWGKVMDMYIPPKRDKKGQKFGFVKFRDVGNATAFEEKMQIIQLGDKILGVNLSHYNRDFFRRFPPVPQRQDQKRPYANLNVGANIRSEVSYSRAVAEGRCWEDAS